MTTKNRLSLIKQLLRESNFNELINVCREIVENTPNDIDSWKILGFALKASKQPDAEKVLKIAMKLDPLDPDTINNLGNLYLEKLNFKESELAFRAALSLDGRHAAALSNLGLLMQKICKYDESIKFYQQAIEQLPDQAEFWYQLGVSRRNNREFWAALGSFEKALELNPKDLKTLISLSELQQTTGFTEKSLNSALTALKFYPDNTKALNNYATLMRDLGLDLQAQYFYKCALNIDKSNHVTVANLAISSHGLWHLKEAKKYYKVLSDLYVQDQCDTSEKVMVTALMPLGRSGSLFLHSLIDGHPQIRTLPGFFFKGWFGLNQWGNICPSFNDSSWRETLFERIYNLYEPMFDAQCRRSVPGFSLQSNWIAKDFGFVQMGEKRLTAFKIEKEDFRNKFLQELSDKKSVTSNECFEIVHTTYNLVRHQRDIKKQNKNAHIFFHIHNPDTFELTGFLHHYPNARFLFVLRKPIQSLESWLMLDVIASPLSNSTQAKQAYHLARWNRMVDKIVSMFIDMCPVFISPIQSKGIKLEDIKTNPKKAMSSLASWLEIENLDSLYESTFNGLQYWGPLSKNTGAISGFDPRAINHSIGRIFGVNDLELFEILFWPLESMYQYTDRDEKSFNIRLIEVEPLLHRPLYFEQVLYKQLGNGVGDITELAPYRRLHSHLRSYWETLVSKRGELQLPEPIIVS